MVWPFLLVKHYEPNPSRAVYYVKIQTLKKDITNDAAPDIILFGKVHAAMALKFAHASSFCKIDIPLFKCVARAGPFKYTCVHV